MVMAYGMAMAWLWHGYDMDMTPVRKCYEIVIKSRANILTRVQSKAYTEPSSFNSLFNLPFSTDIHNFSQARHIAHSTTQCHKFFIYYSKL